VVREVECGQGIVGGEVVRGVGCVRVVKRRMEKLTSRLWMRSDSTPKRMPLFKDEEVIEVGGYFD
jgi:hypothetical protein